MSADPSEYFDDGRFIPSTLAGTITGETVEHYLVTPITLKGGDTIWKYHCDLGIFKADGISWVETRAREELGERVKPHFIKEVVKIVMIDTYTDPCEFEEDPNVIVTLNGVYHLDTGEFTSHNAIYNAKNRWPVIYDPEADCPKIKKFLGEVMPNDIPTFQEWLGYHLKKDQAYQKAMMFIGDGANGKGTTLRLMTALIGNENISNVTLAELTSNRFAKAELHLKIANLSPDSSNREIKSTGVFLAITGGDWMSAERKHMHPFDFRPYSKLTFQCNVLPRTPDDTRAFFRRWLFINFPNRFEEEKADKNLLQKLTTPEELSGFFNWALEGLKRLFSQGGFTGSKSTEEMQEIYRELSDSVTAFIKTHIVKDPSAFETKDAVYNAYYQFCRKKGLSPILKQTLGKELKPRIPGLKDGKRKVGKDRKPSWIGIKLINIGAVHGVQGGEGPSLFDHMEDINEKRRTPDTPDTLDSLQDKMNHLFKIIEGFTDGISTYGLTRKTGFKGEELDRMLNIMKRDGVVFRVPGSNHWKVS